jgi:hypothetical protein
MSSKKHEMVDYSAMQSHLEKKTLLYFTFSQKSEEPIRAVIHHLPPDTSAEDISNSLENLGFVINMKQMTATRAAPNGQIHVKPLPLFLVTLMKNIISQEIFKPMSLNHIIKVGLY